MDIIVAVTNRSQYYLVRLEQGELMNEIRGLIRKSRHASAMSVALTKGRLVRELCLEECWSVDADMTLTPNGAYWSKM